MISADNKEIKVGDVVFNRWGEAERITSTSSTAKEAVYCNRVEGGNVSHVLANTLYKSEKAALENEVAWIARKAFEAEQTANGLRTQEGRVRVRIVELEKEEEAERQRNEVPDDLPQDD